MRIADLREQNPVDFLASRERERLYSLDFADSRAGISAPPTPRSISIITIRPVSWWYPNPTCKMDLLCKRPFRSSGFRSASTSVSIDVSCTRFWSRIYAMRMTTPSALHTYPDFELSMSAVQVERRSSERRVVYLYIEGVDTIDWGIAVMSNTMKDMEVPSMSIEVRLKTALWLHVIVYETYSSCQWSQYV